MGTSNNSYACIYNIISMCGTFIRCDHYKKYAINMRLYEIKKLQLHVIQTKTLIYYIILKNIKYYLAIDIILC